MRRVSGAARTAAWPAVLGLATAAGQAPLGLWWLALPALSLLTSHIARAPDGRARLWRGWTGGVGYFLGTVFWIIEPFMVDAARDGWMAPFALVFLCGGMALFWLAAAALADLGRSPAGRGFGFATGLAASDLLRSYAATGFPWALVGHIWIGTPVAQAAAFVGPIGLSVLTVGLALLPALSARAAWRGAGVAAGLAVLAVMWIGGAQRLAAPEAARAEPIRVRLVQPNATQALKWQPGMWDIFIDRQIQATLAPAEKPLSLIVWPETSIPYLLDDAKDFLGEVTGLSGGVPLAVGIQRAEGNRYYNALAVTGPAGDVRAVYDKHHLTPFGEYVPFGDFLARFGISAFAAQQGHGYTPGAGPAVLDLGPAGKVLPLICYEAIFPQDLRVKGPRPDWILQITNDGWFGQIAGPYQHLAQARLRAIEQGLPLMRVANTGVTAAIDARGRVLQSLPLATEGWIDAEVPAALPVTLYARTGDLPATMWLVGCILALAWPWRARPR
jgi:apolipoprotein N-acyltransferase